MKRMHHVESQAQEGAWSCRRSRGSSRSIGTAGMFFRAPDMMGDTPGVTGASASMVRTRRVEKTGQEVGQASEADRETPSVIGSARAMATESREMGDDAGWMVQRADHAATRNESKRTR